MPYRICKRFEIESGHLLSKHPGQCRFPHGHSRTIEVVLVADALDARDMVCDFKALKSALADFLATWDHALCVNTADPQFAYLRRTYGAQVVPFSGTDPTSEVLARAVFLEAQHRLQALAHDADPLRRIPAGVRVERVRVSETSSSWAEYFEAGGA